MLTDSDCIGRYSLKGSATRLLISLLLLTALAAPAAAITLETYFLELNERERGAYVVGFIDLFTKDASREDKYRECVAEAGPHHLHEQLTESVRDDPRMLAYDAASWLLYTAASLCKNGEAQKPEPSEPATPAGDSVPEMRAHDLLRTATNEEGAEVLGPAAWHSVPAIVADRPALSIGFGILGGALVGLIAGGLLGRLRPR